MLGHACRIWAQRGVCHGCDTHEQDGHRDLPAIAVGVAIDGSRGGSALRSTRDLWPAGVPCSAIQPDTKRIQFRSAPPRLRDARPRSEKWVRGPDGSPPRSTHGSNERWATAVPSLTRFRPGGRAGDYICNGRALTENLASRDVRSSGVDSNDPLAYSRRHSPGVVPTSRRNKRVR